VTDQEHPDRPALPEVVRVTLAPLPGHGAPFHHRVKRLLKAALRSFGLKCVRIEMDQPTK
jgi:hypothetical protein